MPSTKEWALSYEDLRRVLSYDPETGVWTWQIDVGRRGLAGDRAGGHHADGYRQIAINDIKYLEHRLAFFYVTKKWPINQVDHINGVRNDNRWENLREATIQQNTRNRKRHKNNVSGYKGVSLHGLTGKFQASVMTGGKSKYLGLFDTPEAASVAYEAAAKEQFGEFYPDKLN